MKKLRPYLIGIRYSLPMQLLLLHFKRYQILLVFWYVLFATVNGSFLHRFGAHILYLFPEYLGEVNAASLALVGAAFAVFFMSWNITTFILHAKHIRFLATTTQPFLKYCINNAIIPLAFLIFYFVKATVYVLSQELLQLTDILGLSVGFLTGFALAVALGFTYFFGADRTIYRFMAPALKEELIRYKNNYAEPNGKREKGIVRVDWYLSATVRLRRPRSVSHYTQAFIDRLFKQHHIAAMISVMIAFGTLIVIGYSLENRFFQLPAAASITVFFSILIAVAGAFSYFLQSWAMLFLLTCFFGLNILYKQKILDPRNKAIGLNYNTDSVPTYNKASLLALANPEQVKADSLRYIGYLNEWKSRQPIDSPVIIFASFSGGGSRSATFSTYVLQHLDSVTNNRIMPAAFMFFGASGGMVGAAWYRELYLRKLNTDSIHPQSQQYADAISGDLLNPIFTSLVVRDMLAPTQSIIYNGSRYKKDRGLAFEDKLNANTYGWMDKTLKEYRQAEDSGLVPRVLINAVITRDGRKLLMGTSPVRFLMRPLPDSNTDSRADPDAVDFMSYFAAQQPGGTRMLSALRMNATFPYILPNVWLPTKPVIDVMDAGFRDNTGLESSMRFMYYFRHWLKQNCSRVILVQVRDKQQGGWESPVESNSIFDLITTPALLSQNNLFRFQEYAQMRELELFSSYYGNRFSRVVIEYQPSNKDAAASMSFHLTQKEKQDLKASLTNEANSAAFKQMDRLFKQEVLPDPIVLYELGSK